MSKRTTTKRSSPMTDEQIVEAYQAHDLPRRAEELAWFAEPQSHRLRVERAAGARLRSGKRCPHQYRFSESVLAEATRRLLANERLSHIEGFAELLTEVDATIRPIRGVGPLYVFDTALRFGASKNIEPSTIYMHAGARQGARRLLGSAPGVAIQVSALPPAYGCLTAGELENLLCCYHRNFIPISARGGSRSHPTRGVDNRAGMAMTLTALR